MIEPAPTDPAIGYGVQPAAQDADPVQLLGRPPASLIRLRDPTLRMVREGGDHAHRLALITDPGSGELVHPCRGSGRFRDEVVADVGDAHVRPYRLTGRPVRADSTAAKVTRVTCAASCGSTGDVWPERTASTNAASSAACPLSWRASRPPTRVVLPAACRR